MSYIDCPHCKGKGTGCAHCGEWGIVVGPCPPHEWYWGNGSPCCTHCGQPYEKDLADASSAPVRLPATQQHPPGGAKP
jgi:hypothetical protein